MRKLLIIISILTALLSGLVGLGVVSGQGQADHPGCLIINDKASNNIIYDLSSEKRLYTFNSTSRLSPSSQTYSSRNKRSALRAVPLANGKFDVHLMKQDGTYKFLHTAERLYFVRWSPDERNVAYSWKGEQGYLSILFDGQFPVLLPISWGSDYQRRWTADSQYFMWTYEHGSLVVGQKPEGIWQWRHNDFIYIYLSPLRHRLAYTPLDQPNTSSYTINIFEAGKDDSHRSYVFSLPPNRKQGSGSWSPDGRYFVVAAPEYRTILDTVTGNSYTIEGEFENYGDLLYMINKPIFVIAQGRDQKTQTAVLFDLETRTQQPIISDPTLKVLSVKAAGILYSTTNADKSINLHQMKLDGSHRTLVENIQDDYELNDNRPTYDHLTIRAERGEKGIFVLYDKRAAKSTFVGEFPNKYFSYERFSTEEQPTLKWLAINNYIREGEIHSFLINIESQEVRQMGKGEFARPGIYKFNLPDGLVFTGSQSSDVAIYEVFDLDGNSLGKYTLPQAHTELWKKIAPKQDKILTAQVIDDNKVELWVIDRDGRTLSHIISQPAPGSAWTHYTDWTWDGKYIILAQDAPEGSNQQGIITLYDEAGNIVYRRSTKPTLMQNGFDVGNCGLTSIH